MTDTTTRSAAPGADGTPGAAGPRPQGGSHPARPGRRRSRLHSFWKLFYDKTIGLGLILAMAVLVLAGTLIRQMPDSVKADPQARADWLQSVRRVYGGWVKPLDVLGMFDVWASPLFLAVSFLLVCSIIGCTLHRMPLLWQKATHPHTHAHEPFFDHAGARATVSTPLSQQEVFDRAREALRKERYRIVEDGQGPGLNLYANRNRWFPFGTALAHAAFVIIIAAMAVSSTTGFKDDSVAVPIGSRVDIGHDTGLSVEAKSFDDTYDVASGRPTDYVSDLIVYRDGQQAARQEVRVNTPLRIDGVKIHQQSFGIAAMMTVRDAAGKVVYSGGVPLKFSSDDEQTSIGRFTVPGSGLDVYVGAAASGQQGSGIGPGQVRLEVFGPDQEQPLDSQVVDQGRPTRVGDLTYTFERERSYTGLSVVRDPGAPLVWLGSVLIVLGTVATMFFRHRRIWVRVHPARPEDGPQVGSILRIASAERHDSLFEARFRRLVARVAGPGARHATFTGSAARVRPRPAELGDGIDPDSLVTTPDAPAPTSDGGQS